MPGSMSIYDFEVKTIDGKNIKLREFEGKFLVIVNVASQCGFTSQYEGLEKLYRKYREKGVVVMGFPCNQFGSQEPGDEAEIQKFCQLKYDVTFPMYAKISVNGPDTHPLYAFLKSEEKGLLGTEGIKWNFTKFFVGTDGKVLKRLAPQVTPEAMEKEIEKYVEGR